MAAANNEFFEALSMLEHERGITAEYLIEKIKAAIVIAVKKNYEVEDDHVMVEIADLWLVHQVKLLAAQGVSQVFLQFTTPAHFAVDAGDIKLISVARAALGQGHGLLGFLQQLLGAVAIFREQRDADGCAQADQVMVEGELSLQVVEDALRQFGGFVRLVLPRPMKLPFNADPSLL